jgi:energy-coupling factor transporter ATP-binding protein EcfA2
MLTRRQRENQTDTDADTGRSAEHPTARGNQILGRPVPNSSATQARPSQHYPPQKDWKLHMRLKAIDATDVPPVRRFCAQDLSDIIVLAGPNGVGKTRLIERILQALQSPVNHASVRFIIEPTCDQERQQWGQATLDTSIAAEAQKLAQTLQANRRRTSWRSSVVQFESDRTIKPYNPYAFSFDTTDPWEEPLGWNATFGYLRDRFQDTLHAIFRKTQNRRDALGRRAEELLLAGKTSMTLDGFPDPLLPFKDAFSQLLGPKTLLDADIRTQQLFYEHNKQRFPVTALSSGEREVVNIVFDFIMRNPSDSIVFFDEPELHLHPELSYRLIQTLKNVGERNQFIFCTHSADIISASLDNTVIFLAPPRDGGSANQAIIVREDDETQQALRLLGQSIGIISLGRKLVLIEGTQGSLDKQTYGSILKNRFPNLVLVPSGGKGVISSFSALMDGVLAKTIWGVEFFMVCDRDAIPLSRQIESVEEAGKGRLKMLRRYHLENYFLEAPVLAEAFAGLEPEGSWLRNPDAIDGVLREIAKANISYAASLIVASEYREAVGNLDIMPSQCNNKPCEELVDLFKRRVNAESTRVNSSIDVEKVATSVRATIAKLERSLEDESWKDLIPGRPILNSFAARARLDPARLKRLYLQKAETHATNPFRDIIDLFKHFSLAGEAEARAAMDTGGAAVVSE